MRPAAAALIWALAACAEQDPFLREVAQLSRPQGQDRVEISHIAQRYLPAGTSLAEAQKFAEQRGFKVYPYQGRNVPSGQKWLIATKHDRYYVIFAEETRLILESDGKQLSRVRAWLFLKGI